MKDFIQIIYLSICLVFLISQWSFGNDTSERLPQSWYELPEDAGYIDSHSIERERGELSQGAERAIERIYEVNASALDRAHQYRSRNSKWGLQACIFDISISGAGNVGMLVAKGEASVSLYWRPKKEEMDQNKAVSDGVVLEDEVMTLDPELSREGVMYQLEPLVQTLVASGRVKNEDALRKNLTKEILDYHLVVQYLTQFQSTRWSVSRLRLDFSVDISGKVNPAVTVGGGLKLRFEWEPRKHFDKAVPMQRYSEKGENLKQVVQNLLQQMQQVSYEGIETTGYRLSSIKIGLGLFAEGKFGVVKVGGSVFGYLYLAAPRPGEIPKPIVLPLADQIPVLDYTFNSDYLKFADSHNLKYEVISATDETPGLVVYQADGSAFRKGLENAVTIGSKFVEKAGGGSHRWELYQLKTEFALSITGSVALFKLGGTGAIELVFQK